MRPTSRRRDASSSRRAGLTWVTRFRGGGGFRGLYGGNGRPAIGPAQTPMLLPNPRPCFGSPGTRPEPSSCTRRHGGAVDGSARACGLQGGARRSAGCLLLSPGEANGRTARPGPASCTRFGAFRACPPGWRGWGVAEARRCCPYDTFVEGRQGARGLPLQACIKCSRVHVRATSFILWPTSVALLAAPQAACCPGRPALGPGLAPTQTSAKAEPDRACAPVSAFWPPASRRSGRGSAARAAGRFRMVLPARARVFAAPNNPYFWAN
jgi:hypothetical protein